MLQNIFLTVKIFLEERGAGDDGVQAGDGPLQVVRAADQGGELHPHHREEALHQLPQTGQQYSVELGMKVPEDVTFTERPLLGPSPG